MGATTTRDPGGAARSVLGYSRWWQIVAAGVMMALVSPYQYVWTALEGPLADALGTSLSVLGFVFTLFVILMALVQFPAGWWRDRYGPRRVTLAAGVLAGVGYLGLSISTTVWHVYLTYAIGSLGVGMVYTVAVNTAIKWFPDRRGLTTGIGTMAFAAGSAAFIPFVRYMVVHDALSTALASMGILICVGITVGTVVLRDPPDGWHRSLYSEDESTGSDPGGSRTDGGANRVHYTWREMVRTWQFWVMYFMFFAVSAAGLMITARVILYAEQAGLTAAVATIAATVLPIASGGGRLIVGGLSDRFDRERITAVSFLTCGVGTVGVVAFAGLGSNVGYVLAVAIAVFFWSSQFSLFPSLVGDYYGAKHSSANYSIVYSGKMWGGVFGGGVVGWLVGTIGWDAAFLIGGALALAAGVAGLLLRPPA